jgi:hypothetical protein
MPDVMSAHLNRPRARARPRARLETAEAHDVPQPNHDPTALGQISDRAALSRLQFRARARAR